MTRAARASLEATQLRQLKALLRAILPHNRFYARKLTAAGFSLRPRASLADTLAALPFTTKEELVADQAAHPPYGTCLTYPVSRYTRFHQTSGTTGTPLRWLDTPEDWDWMVANRLLAYRAAGIRASDRILFPFSFGPFLGFWLGFEAAERLGCLRIAAGGLNTSARLRCLVDNRVTVLSCTPTYALRLGEAAREEKIPQRHLHVKTILVAGEPGGSIPAVRDRIARFWPGARVIDTHGMTETGPVTYESPRHPCALLVMEHAYIAEILDPATFREVSPGQIGELVLTSLGRTGSPLLRYRTGDLVRKTYIGSKLALEGGILSRADDMLVIRGVNLYPSAVETLVRSLPAIAEYRVEVRRLRGMAEISLLVEPTPACRDPQALAAKLAAALHRSFALRIPVSAVPPGSLPKFEMKAKRWIVSQDSAAT